MMVHGYQRTKTAAAVNCARWPASASARIAERWPSKDDTEDAEISTQLAAITQFYQDVHRNVHSNVAPEPAAFAAASGLAVMAKSALGHVCDSYLTPWSAGDVRHKLMAVTVLSAMAEDQRLDAAALDIAVGWACHGGQEAVTAAIAFGGPLGERHLSEAMRWLWALTMQDQRVSQIASLAFGQLFAVEIGTNSDRSAIAGFLTHKVRQQQKSQTAAHERQAALAMINAALSAARSDSPTPAVAELLRVDLQPVAELWAAALNSVPHRRTAVIALHLTLAALTEDTDSVALAVSLGRAILPELTARTREVLELTLPDPQRTEAISARLIAAFLEE